MALGEFSHPVWKFRTAILLRIMFVIAGERRWSVETTCGLPAGEGRLEISVQHSGKRHGLWSQI